MDCSKKDCKNPPAWRPVLLLYPPADYKSPPVKMLMNLPICDHHKKEMKIEELLTDRSWEFVLKVFKQQGLHEPERALTKLAFYKIPEGR